MSSTLEKLPTIEEVLGSYKRALANWEVRADNESPANNQKGRIISEIDAEAADTLHRVMAAVRIDEYANHMPHTRNKPSYNVDMRVLEERMAELREFALGKS